MHCFNFIIIFDFRLFAPNEAFLKLVYAASIGIFGK